MKIKFYLKCYLPTILLIAIPLYCQDEYEVYIDPNLGDRIYRKEALMNGNQVETMIANWGSIGRGSHPYSGVWPRGTGHDHVYEMTLLVTAQVSSGGNKYSIASHSFLGGEVSSDGSTEWAWQPLPGYSTSNLWQDTLAISTRSSTWPTNWPGKEEKWNNNWNGYFGLGIENANMECLFVLDDSKNAEFDFYPDPWNESLRGLGLQVETRMFQWVHPLAEDAIFVHYAVTNVSKTTYGEENPIYFGMFADTHPGGMGSTDDDSYFDLDHNMVYAWDHDNIGRWLTYTDILPGYLGWKYLESPGIGDDFIDNDRDGLVDEKRDDPAGDYIFGPIGNYGTEKWHWEGDEDGDWLKLLDDVGTDGVGNLDDHYSGPDLDGTEGNGIPDQGEPNFGITDNDESDQIGLTGFVVRQNGAINTKNDRQLYELMSKGSFDTEIAQTTNNIWVYSSGTFPLYPNKTERFSLALLFGETLDDITHNARTVQRIYESDYRFAKPPKQATLKAIPGDGKITLTWDTIAEFSRDPVYGFDFEGYKIYKSTEPSFLESRNITGGYGSARYISAYKTFDIKNGLKGLHPIALGEEGGNRQNTGAHYFLGNDTGIKHSFVDYDVVNGMRYYYALASFDRGWDFDFYERELSDFDSLVIISPSESPYTIKEEAGLVTSIDRNCAVVTPGTYPAGYLDPSSALDDEGAMFHIQGNATGKIYLNILNPSLIKQGHTLQVTFSDSIDFFKQVIDKNAFVKDISSGDTLLVVTNINEHDSSFPYGGVTYTFEEDTVTFETTKENTYWNEFSEMHKYSRILLSGKGSKRILVPFDMDIIFYDTNVDSAWNRNINKKIAVPFEVINKTNEVHLDLIFDETRTRDGKIEPLETIQIVNLFEKENGTMDYKVYWVVQFLADDGEFFEPAKGDTLKIRVQKPFQNDDIFEFSMDQLVSNERAKNELENIKVVPNPYVVTNAWEQKNTTTIGRGDRKIQFTHLPKACTIKILSTDGYLIDTIIHNGSDLNGSKFWDLKTKDNMDIAFGIYFYHINAPGIGEKVGKFAVIK